MFSKTSSIEFLKYGEIFNGDDNINIANTKIHNITIQNDTVTSFYKADYDIYLRSTKGICMLIVSNDINTTSFDKFVIHRIVKINKGVYFNFAAIESEAVIQLIVDPNITIKSIFSENHYTIRRIRPSVRVNEILAYYYNIRGTEYSFTGEKNNYWELTYVDIGELHTTVDNNDYILTSNQLMLYGPGQFHKERTTNKSCSYLTVVFEMDIKDEFKKILLNKVFETTPESRNTLEYIVTGGDRAASYDEDTMILSIEKEIILLIKQVEDSTKKSTNSSIHQKLQNELINEIILFLNENIDKPINVAELCQTFAISRGTLQALFNKYLNMGPKEYMNIIKLKKSKQLIKEGKHTISEVSYLLGFSSVQYFSRLFKAKYGITPSEFANTII